MGNVCFCASKVSICSSVGLAMASNLRILTHKNPSTCQFAWSSSPWQRKLYNTCSSFSERNSSVCTMRSLAWAASPAPAAVGAKPLGSCNRKHVIKKQWSRDGLEFCRVAGLRHGVVKVRGSCTYRPNVVVTTEGPADLSFESSSGQVNGDAENDDGSDGTQFPRGGNIASPTRIVNVKGENAVSSASQIAMMAELEDALGFPLGQGPQSPSPKPLVIVISGPSGVGKDAVIKQLQHVRGDIHFVVTATTRPMRPGEVDGVDYFFMSRTEFQEMIENHELLEHAIVYGDYKGIPKQQVRECMNMGMDVVLRVDVQGAATVRAILGSEAVFIFLVAESEVALVRRLIERKTETMDKMLVRVATAREELTRMEEFDYVVVNAEGMLDNTVGLICSIIDAEKARVKPKAAEL
ncbi:guanylate kinase [Marchantia polymorpha subsp. ruderalis]|uniref:guanylate kinase n=2 Tax=Marchantia polymorpha TaxID=3197 RepID=A0AAF6AJU9_MARPO|nr:hypothetical protein MARPO_0103s0074 [Marchantia polymorpha]BBM96719.1 hypothetical protein Mp_1g00120 [Marchantia polymorpha subsp. ruderalis]|eukprot:PTQ32109.1 hypothetical protein MARPO_0103s0074 [Marchantia polymorpha]